MNEKRQNEIAQDAAGNSMVQAFEQLLEREQAPCLPLALSCDPEPPAIVPENGCPGVDQWLQLALGDLPPGQWNVLFSHAASCGHCAAQLRLSLRLLHEANSPDEEAELQHLQAATPAWQHRMAVELAKSPRKPAPNLLFKRPFWAGAISTILLMILVLAYFWQQMHTPERLLAQAYSHKRNLEFRIPGAEHAAIQPQTHQRGGMTSKASALLLDAQARIQRNLEKSPNDAHWLQLQARANVLDEKFDSSIDLLDRLIAAGPVTLPLLSDAATAYYHRGIATGSESDRATALEYLRRADELNPNEPVVLFNEAIALEDRGQIVNAVELWNRFLRYEKDPKWLAEGRERLAKLEEKLNRLKSHQSRIQQLLSDPASMRALAADPGRLASLDEELSVEWLPELLNHSFVAPTNRSRGSPCESLCQTSRELLSALAGSLLANHQDSWLSHLLSSPASSSSSPSFLQAAHSLATGLEFVRTAKYSLALQPLRSALSAFQAQGNDAGADLAQAELSFVLYRMGGSARICYQQAHPLVGRHPQFAWIQLLAGIQEQLCDTSPGVDAADRESYRGLLNLAIRHHYELLEMRVRNLIALPAVNTTDTEKAWQIYTPVIRKFWSGDYPAYRLFTSLSGLAELEAKTPRSRTALLLQREAVATLGFSYAFDQMIPGERLDLVRAAIRAGSAAEAKTQLQLAQKELNVVQDQNAALARVRTIQMELARLYTAQHDFQQARLMLDAYRSYYRSRLSGYLLRDAGIAEAELELASSVRRDAELLLHDAILDQEHDASTGHSQFVGWARQQRDSYAAQAGLWLARGRPPEEILALWERYRMRILDLPVPPCPHQSLNCLQPKIAAARARLDSIRLIGQIVLADRTLIYEVGSNAVKWTSIPVGRQELAQAAESLERAVSSPNSSLATVDQAAQRLGRILFGNLSEPLKPGSLIALEPDPVLGNLPWTAIETAAGKLGLAFDLVESPSMAIQDTVKPETLKPSEGEHSLIVGASWTGGNEPPLPEAIHEANTVARYYRKPDLLLGQNATAQTVMARISSAPIIHFAGHASQSASGTHLLLAPSPEKSGNNSDGLPTFLDSQSFRKFPPRSARLIVFSACSSGKRQAGWNNGIVDIVDTLAGLGVPEVVATRWQIDSAVAAAAMNRFYAHLAQGENVPSSLTAARVSIAADPRYRHPYYWAAYYVSGIRPIFLNQALNPPAADLGY